MFLIYIYETIVWVLASICVVYLFRLAFQIVPRLCTRVSLFPYDKFQKKLLNGMEEYFKTAVQNSRLPGYIFRLNFVGWCLMLLDPRYGTSFMSVTLLADTNFVDASINFWEKFCIPPLECHTLNRTVESAASHT
jgi:hypothetical protein